MKRLVLTAATVLLGAVALPIGCGSVGDGRGEVIGFLNTEQCWVGEFSLKPDFFAAIPYRRSMILRIQRGSDYQEFSDGLSVIIDDIDAIRPSDKSAGTYGQPMKVDLSPEVTPPGVPVKAISDPAKVHAALYLQRSCRTQNNALHALGEVTIDSVNCGDLGDAAPASEGGPASLCPVDGGAPAAAPRVGRSTITFTSLFNGNPDETAADERLIEATFDLYLADPRELCAGGIGPPPPCRGHVTGSFKFFFQRGRPAQPFP